MGLLTINFIDFVRNVAHENIENHFISIMGKISIPAAAFGYIVSFCSQSKVSFYYILLFRFPFETGKLRTEFLVWLVVFSFYPKIRLTTNSHKKFKGLL